MTRAESRNVVLLAPSELGNGLPSCTDDSPPFPSIPIHRDRLSRCPLCRQGIDLIVKLAAVLGTWEERGNGKKGASDEIQ